MHGNVPTCKLGYLTRQQAPLKFTDALKLSLQFAHILFSSCSAPLSAVFSGGSPRQGKPDAGRGSNLFLAEDFVLSVHFLDRSQDRVSGFAHLLCDPAQFAGAGHTSNARADSPAGL
jgi:hypothetical protein